MINEEKLNKLKKVGIVVALIISLLVGYGVGSIKQHKPTNKGTKQQSLFNNKNVEELTQEDVEAFLIAYFTKKDLGENRNRYKPFMTEGMYQQSINIEEEPTNKTYQGFVVDFVYKDAVIYINDQQKTAIVTVNYTNTLLAQKDNYKEAQKNVLNTASYRIVYTATQTGQLLVNKIEPLLLEDNNGSENKTITLE